MIKSAVVCGGRNYQDADTVHNELDRFPGLELIINGGCSGADALATNYAFNRGIGRHIVDADWEKYGRAAGPIRNRAMLDLDPDIVIAFPGGRGTANMIKAAIEAGYVVVEIVK